MKNTAFYWILPYIYRAFFRDRSILDFKFLESVGLPASTLGGRVHTPFVLEGCPTDSRDEKKIKGCR